MFYYCGIVSMRYLLTDYFGEHSNNHIISAILRCLVANATLLKLIEGDYICGGSTSSHSEQRSKTRKNRWYCNAIRKSRKSPIYIKERNNNGN